jgi:hypothetical protein
MKIVTNRPFKRFFGANSVYSCIGAARSPASSCHRSVIPWRTHMFKALITVCLSGCLYWGTASCQQEKPLVIENRNDVKTKAPQISERLATNPKSFTKADLVTAYNNLSAIESDALRSEVKSRLQREMQSQGLFEPFAANLDTAAELTDTGTGNVPSATGSLQPQAKGLITWESAHFGDGHKIDFSFGGHFGYAPLYTLVNLTSSGSALPPHARPMFQQGFVWSMRPQINFRTGDFHDGQLSSEFAIFGTVGQTILTSTVSSFKQSDNTINATTVANNVGNGAPFLETGVQFRLYNTDLTTVHRDKSYLSPAFFVEGGFKSDGRFKAEGDLAGYDSPRDRAFFRFLVSINKVTNARGTTEPKEPFSVDFGIDHELPISESRVPGATRIIIRGSLDVVKLLKGSN